MIRSLVLRQIDAAERALGEGCEGSMDYLRHILGVSLGAFMKFYRFVGVSSYRSALGREPFHVARIVATLEEDCGTCVQMAVNMARQDGVSVEVLRACVDRRPDDLSEDLRDVYRFTEEVVQATWGEDELRDTLRKRLGEEAFVELAMAIATCRVYPIAKRALGHAKSCRMVTVTV